MGKTSIEWCDMSWSPVVGCTMVSEGCRNCYAVSMTRRLAAMGQAKYAGLVNPGKGHFNGTVRLHEPSMHLPLRWRKPRRIFVNPMSDLFHERLPDEAIDRIFAVMALTPRHTYQVLTKRPERMRAYMSEEDEEGRKRSQVIGLESLGIALDMFSPRSQVGQGIRLVREGELKDWPLPNVCLCVSVEDQPTADMRILPLLKTPAAVRGVSYEPALGPLDLSEWTTSERCQSCGRMYREVWSAPNADWARVVGGPGGLRCPACYEAEARHSGIEPVLSFHGRVPGIDWVICGGESGPGARPCDIEWVRSLRDQCQFAGAPFFFKQRLNDRGRKVSLPELDGRQWAQMP